MFGAMLAVSAKLLCPGALPACLPVSLSVSWSPWLPCYAMVVSASSHHAIRHHWVAWGCELCCVAAGARFRSWVYNSTSTLPDARNRQMY